MLKNLTAKRNTGQHPKISGVVFSPSTELHRVKIDPGVIPSLIEHFFAMLAATATELWTGPDYKSRHTVLYMFVFRVTHTFRRMCFNEIKTCNL